MYQVQVVQEGNAGKQLPCKTLNMTVGERREEISFEEIKDADSIKICNDAFVLSVPCLNNG